MINQDIYETAVVTRWDESTLFRYVYQPDDPVVESPRPYLHPVRTLAGDLVSIRRPHDHVWHKGISLALPNVGPHNFWGGVTYRRGEGYVQLPNNGTTRHDGFDRVVAGDDSAALAERLTWLTQDGETLLTESRRIGVAAWPADGAWMLRFETTLENVSPRELRFGSPTTEGRENAGYGGLFWRGPRSFTGGKVITPDRIDPGSYVDPDSYMGVRAPWLAFTGQHDGETRSSTLIFVDDPVLAGEWFVRSTPFAAVCPGPFFSAERGVVPGEMLNLRYVIICCTGARDAGECGELTARAAAVTLP